ncbi:MAG: RraA family protein [Puniceicoccaceae bacterium]|nr:MAG: RraA family protein [Puniceicoccaceae bacterium]
MTIPENNPALLENFGRLRVADVRDALDTLGWRTPRSVAPDIRPLFRTRACGFARTVRYLPYRGTIPALSEAEYAKWSGRYYGEICTYPWTNELVEGDFAVIDQSGADAGLMGSDNTLGCIRKGCRGFLSNGGVRDTDECILQKVPFWSAFISQGMVQGRIQYDAHNVPVAVGGVTIYPGDVVVADGDGVIVTPREVAEDVARLALEEQERDRKNRRRHYEALGRELDETVT